MYLSQTDSLVTNPQDLVVEHHGAMSCVNNYEDNSWAFTVIYKCLFA